MVARLVFDAIWRNRWLYSVVVMMLLPFWLAFGVSGSDPLPISTTSLSLSFAVVLGPMAVIATMSLRALRHLPASNRDLWRATWVVGTVVAAGVLLVSKTVSALLVAAFGGSPTVSAEAILLSTAYEFSWAGTVLPLFPLLGHAGHAVAHRGTLAASCAAAAPTAAVLAGFGLPILVSDALPMRLSEFTSATTGVLVAGLAIAFGGLAWTPERGVLAGERAQSRRAFVSPGTTTRTRLIDRLTGISRVAVPYLLATLALPIGACLALAAYGVISGTGPWWFVPHAPTVFDPADTGDRGLTYFVLLPCAFVTMHALWTPWVRLLKVLPLSVRQINALLIVTPFAAWMILWLLGWSGYAFAYGTPPTMGVDLAFGLAGIGALAHAALLRFQGSLTWVIASIGGLMPQLLKAGLRDGTDSQIVFAVVGAIALCTAAFVNHDTLTRSTSSSRAYQRPQPPVGFPAKTGIR
jgi:hypothetical protein